MRCNDQTAVDDRAHISVAAERSNSVADVGQLVPMLQAVKANTGQVPAQALDDAGCRGEQNFAGVAVSPTDLVVAKGREVKRCVEIDATANPHMAAMVGRVQAQQGKTAYRRRNWIAEPPHDWIKNALGFRQFILRGRRRVQAEFKLVCLALNLRRMYALKAA